VGSYFAHVTIKQSIYKVSYHIGTTLIFYPRPVPETLGRISIWCFGTIEVKAELDPLRDPRSIKLHLLLDAQGLFGCEGAEVAHGHKDGGMSQVDLQSSGVAGLPQALYGSRVPEQMRIDAFREPGLFRDFFDDLPGPLAIDFEDPVVKAQVLVEGIALEAMR